MAKPKGFDQKLFLKLSRYIWNIAGVSGFVSLILGIILFALSQKQYVDVHNALAALNNRFNFLKIDFVTANIGKRSEKLDKKIQTILRDSPCKNNFKINNPKIGQLGGTLEERLLAIRKKDCNLNNSELKKIARINKQKQKLNDEYAKFIKRIEMSVERSLNYSPYIIEQMYSDRRSESLKLIVFGLTLVALSSLPAGFLYYVEKNSKDKD